MTAYQVSPEVVDHFEALAESVSVHGKSPSKIGGSKASVKKPTKVNMRTARLKAQIREARALTMRAMKSGAGAPALRAIRRVGSPFLVPNPA